MNISSITIVDFNESYKEPLEHQLLELVNHVAQFNPLRRKKADSRYANNYLLNLLSEVKQNKAIIKVAVSQNSVVGFAVGLIKEKTSEELLEFLHDKVGFISDVYIDSEYRGKGIGSLLIKEVEQFFKDSGCIVSELNVATENTMAHDLYERLGYKDNDVNMRKSI